MESHPPQKTNLKAKSARRTPHYAPNTFLMERFQEDATGGQASQKDAFQGPTLPSVSAPVTFATHPAIMAVKAF